MSIGWPALSVTENVTEGALPGVVPVTFRIFVISPGSEADLFGITCAPMMDGPKSAVPCGTWQVAHFASSVTAMLEEEWPWPVAKFTLSWQEPQTSMAGLVFQ